MSTAADNRFYREKPKVREDGGPAFPVEVGTRPIGQNWHQTGSDSAQHYGLSLRDHFAAKAMAAIVSSEAWNVAAAEGAEIEPHHVAAEAYAIADAMLKARSV
jgi:uncharacterized protein (DUF736 family)